jgi:hypothetical protein
MIPERLKTPSETLIETNADLADGADAAAFRRLKNFASTDRIDKTSLQFRAVGKNGLRI